MAPMPLGAEDSSHLNVSGISRQLIVVEVYVFGIGTDGQFLGHEIGDIFPGFKKVRDLWSKRVSLNGSVYDSWESDPYIPPTGNTKSF